MAYDSVSANFEDDDGEEGKEGLDELASVKAQVAYPIQNAKPASVDIDMFNATMATHDGFNTLAQCVGDMLETGGFTEAEREYLEGVKTYYEHCALLAMAMNHGLSDIQLGYETHELPEDSLGVRWFKRHF